MAARELNPREAPVVEVITAVEGWCSLGRRSPTLDGSLPLRVAQGCLPMLDGTALGLQLTLEVPLRLRRRLGGWSLGALPARRRIARWGLDTDPRAGLDELPRAESRRAAAAPALLAQGLVHPAWARALDRPLAEIVRHRTISRLRLFSGLIVRLPAAARLLGLRATPRRTLGVELGPTVIPAHAGWTPLVLDFDLARDGEELVLHGEIATLAVVPATVPVRRAALDETPEAPRALVDFYDAAYFDAKREGEVTKKYRRLVGEDTRVADAGQVTVVGDLGDEIEADALPTQGPASPGGDTTPTVLRVRNALAMEVRFDGQRVWIDPDPEALAARRRRLEAAWAPYASTDDPARRGALWYLTKYLTPHPPGEPHFFVKPGALVVTPAGWSTLVEGLALPGLGETLRGLVHTDRFHATPAVFALPASHRPAHLAAGTTLARLIPLPRAWATPVVAPVPFAPRRAEAREP